MTQQIAANWTATTERAESSYGFPVYVALRCPHGKDIAHSLDEALACRMLADVRRDRGLSQQALATRLGVSVGAVAWWEQGGRRPTGLYRTRLEEWLLAAE
jgi:ribosome-binding protein aMBF1 (putative translation factor)